MILLIKDSLQQQIHFNGKIFGTSWGFTAHCNESSLYMYFRKYPFLIVSQSVYLFQIVNLF